MTDGLYLEKTWVAEVSAVLTYQANDLTKPDVLNASYSLSFTLPDSLLLRSLLQSAEQLDAGGVYPYTALSCLLVQDGSVVFQGLARLVSFSAGWKVSLIETTKGLFDQLAALSIRDLDLSRYDHLWKPESMNVYAGATAGVIYPVIDYGSFDSDTFAGDALFPAVYVHTLIRAMLQRVGYRAGESTPGVDWLADELVSRLALPFVNDEPQSRDQQWVDDRTARVTVSAPVVVPQAINAIIPFSVDNDGQWFDGKVNNFKPTLNAYQCDVGMRLRVQAAQTFSVYVGQGAIEARLIVEKNGVGVAESYFSVSGPYNPTGTKVDTIKLDETINCRASDQIRIRFVFKKRTLIATWATLLVIEPETTWASFTPDPSVQVNDLWPVARNLPDMSCADLLKSIALMLSATYQVDSFRRTLTLIPLDSVIAKTNEAVDWSTRVEESEDPEWFPLLEPYGQTNHLKWKQNDKTKPWGDGIITINAQNLPVVTDLFELPFAACRPSDKTLTGYGNPVLIQTRTLSVSGGTSTLTKATTDARLILIEPTAIVPAQANITSPEGVTSKQAVNLTGCWWGERPELLKLPGNNFTLGFGKVTAAQRETTLIQARFKGLFRILRRPRMLSVSMLLSAEDIATLDLTRPIRLRNVRAGSLLLNDGFYYLNQIPNYSYGTVCRVSLIAYF
ncbi:hypothetical protein [Spirosoma luteum]|uniref:hypothetical protein n=1 Tax=Spirosoma luteum TaxID=431553 RepID=UPI00035E6325|nr:hypothetical protein [Spirosoma luteum]